jgi:hypothetical protein
MTQHATLSTASALLAAAVLFATAPRAVGQGWSPSPQATAQTSPQGYALACCRYPQGYCPFPQGYCAGGDVVVFDNVKPHLAPSVTAAIERTGVRVLRMPPYSPDYTPIEEMYSKVKELL